MAKKKIDYPLFLLNFEAVSSDAPYVDVWDTAAPVNLMGFPVVSVDFVPRLYRNFVPPVVPYPVEPYPVEPYVEKIPESPVFVSSILINGEYYDLEDADME